MSTKPPDEPTPGESDAAKKTSHPDLKAVLGKGDKYTAQSDDNRAVGEHVGGVTGTQKTVTGEAAPEVSQGAWRERAFIPRATMRRDEMLGVLRSSIEPAKARAESPRSLFELLRSEWLPVLRQAMEQAGGDGIDCWLLSALKPPGKAPKSPLLTELIDAFAKMRGAQTVEALLAQTALVIEAVNRATILPRRISFKQMERELEGKVEIHELLLILFSDDAELEARQHEVGGTMETIRGQLKSMPGAKPDGMYSNFARLKAESRVLVAELARRKQP